jgi:hypothetical protein
VTSVFVFGPDGTIPICCYNLPGSIHDNLVAEWGNIYPKLERVYDAVGGWCAVDSAFSFQQYPFIKSGQQHPVSPIVVESFPDNFKSIRKQLQCDSLLSGV